MADTIFIVMASGGEYEDKWSNNIAAFSTQKKAQDHIALLEKRNTYVEELYRKSREHLVTWESLNPQPGRPATATLPKMPQLIKKADRTDSYNAWVDELKANREAIQNANNKLYEEYSDLFSKWNERKTAALEAFIRAYLLNNVEADINVTYESLVTNENIAWSLLSFESTSYDIDEVELIE